jgi:hypothetical protein
MQNKTAIFTSCAANYIPKARVLGSTVKHFHNDIDVYLLLADELPAQFQLENEPFDEVVEAKDLHIPDFERWLFKHRIVEACTAVKPFMLQYLLAKGYEQVMYFDPDIALFFPLTEMLAEFDTASILLTPHQCKPETSDEAVKDNEICSLKHGVFNFGYVGVQNDANGKAYAQWWADRCYFACFEDIAGGNFTDQKWNDLTPVFFDGVQILKSPTYNVATWNYTQRDIQGTPEEGFTVDGMPLIFHHFTGYDSGAHHLMLDKYGKGMPATKDLSEWYENACQHFAQEDLAAVPWIYGCYDNGEAIAPHHRKIYRDRNDLRDAFAHPFSTQAEGRYKTSFYHWLKSEKLWDAPAFDASRAPRPFRAFIWETEAEMRGYLQRTSKLANWQKNIFFSILAYGFWFIRKLSR